MPVVDDARDLATLPRRRVARAWHPRRQRRGRGGRHGRRGRRPPVGGHGGRGRPPLPPLPRMRAAGGGGWRRPSRPPPPPTARRRPPTASVGGGRHPRGRPVGAAAAAKRTPRGGCVTRLNFKRGGRRSAAADSAAQMGRIKRHGGRGSAGRLITSHKHSQDGKRGVQLLVNVKDTIQCRRATDGLVSTADAGPPEGPSRGPLRV